MKRILLIILISNYTFSAFAQRDNTSTSKTNGLSELESMLSDSAKGKEWITGSFKTTRIVNTHSVEQTQSGVLDFKVSHRFNRLDGGWKDFFGLDGAVTRIGFDYGVTDWLQVGVGRSTFHKEYDGYLKTRIVRQAINGSPLALSYAGGISVHSLTPNNPPGTEYFFSNRMFFYNQLLLARKFNDRLTIQLMPSHVHYNIVPTEEESNDILALGIGGRIKLTKRVTFNAEYYYQLPNFRLNGTSNSLSFGLDIETGGHVFQLHFTNSTGMSERTFIGQTTDRWGDGGIRFGFNISRVFTIIRPKGFEGSRNKIY